MVALVQQRKSLVLTLVKQRKNFAQGCIAVVIMVIFLITGKKSTQFCLGSISNKFDRRVMSSQKKYQSKKMVLIFQSIMMLLINHTNITYNIKYNQQCLTQPTVINLHPNEYIQGLHHYPFGVNLDRCAGSCNNLNE